MPLTVLRGAGQALELVGWAVFARRLGPHDFGMLSIAFLLARWGSLIADWGAAQHGARNVARSADRSVEALVRTRVVATGVLMPVFVAGAVVAGHSGLAVLAAVIVNGGMARDWVAVGRGRAVLGSVPLALRGSCLLVGSLLMRDIDQAAMVVGIAYLVATVSSLMVNRRVVDVDVDGRAARRPAAVWALLIVLGAQVYTTLDTLLLGALRSTSEAGVYAALYRIPLAVTTVVGLAMAALVPTLAAELRADRLTPQDARRQVVLLAAGGGGVVLAAIPLLVMVGPTLFGASYAGGRTALTMVLIATAFATGTAPLSSLWLAFGLERQLAVIVTVAAVVNVVGNLALIPRFGMAGAGFTTALSEGIVFACAWSHSSVRRAPRVIGAMT